MLKPMFGFSFVHPSIQPPSGGCVLKQYFDNHINAIHIPAAFRRLCVETISFEGTSEFDKASRLQAAVC